MEKSKIISKLEKLIALATSPNEFEADRAMEKAAEIMKKHNLTMNDLEQGEQKSGLCMSDTEMGKRVPVWKTLIYIKVPAIFSCSTLRKNTRDGSIMCILGEKEDVELAKHFCNYFCIAITMYSKLYQGNKNDFKYAMTLTITDRLKKMYEKIVEDNTTALVVIHKKKKIDDYINQMKNVKTRTTRSKSMTKSDYLAGIKAGKNMAINTPIEQQRRQAIA